MPPRGDPLAVSFLVKRACWIPFHGLCLWFDSVVRYHSLQLRLACAVQIIHAKFSHDFVGHTHASLIGFFVEFGAFGFWSEG